MISPPHILYATSNAGSLAFSSECWLAYKEMPFEIFSNNMISLLGNKKYITVYETVIYGPYMTWTIRKNNCLHN